MTDTHKNIDERLEDLESDTDTLFKRMKGRRDANERISKLEERVIDLSSIACELHEKVRANENENLRLKLQINNLARMFHLYLDGADLQARKSGIIVPKGGKLI